MLLRLLIAVSLALLAARPGVLSAQATQVSPHPQSVNTVRSGSGAPANTLGNDGDFYINYATPQNLIIYGPKAAGAWPAGFAIGGGGSGGAGVALPTITGIAYATQNSAALTAATSANVIGLFGSISAHNVLMAPSSGSGTPLFRALLAADIPALSYQVPLTFSGNGSKVPLNTGTNTSGDCARWDASGNIIDAGAACFALASASPNKVYATNTSGSTSAAPTLRALVAGDIPSLSYQAPLVFTGTGTKTASATAAGVSGNCAAWTSAGDVGDAGAGCGTATLPSGAKNLVVATPASTTGAAALRALVAGDIPSLSYQAPLVFTGTGANTASSTGATVMNDCAKWNAAGDIIDAGAGCGTTTLPSSTPNKVVATNASGSSSAISALRALVPADIPSLSATYQLVLSFTGSGTKTASSTGAGASGDCAKWSSAGDVVDSGAPCGAGGGISTPGTTVSGNIPQWSNTTGNAFSAGLGLVTTVGSPGADTNVPSEAAVNTAIAAALTATGNLPVQTGQASVLLSNGSVVSWGDVPTGGSGGLDCATVPGQCDLDTAIVPFMTSANTWTGLNDFSGAGVLKIVTSSGVPANGTPNSYPGACAQASDVGKIYQRSDTAAVNSSLYICSKTGGSAYSWEPAQGAPPNYTNTGTLQPSAHSVSGKGSFSSSTATISLSAAAVFTSSSTYACMSNDLSTAAGIVKITQTSGTSVTFSLSGGAASDGFSYFCIGN